MLLPKVKWICSSSIVLISGYLFLYIYYSYILEIILPRHLEMITLHKSIILINKWQVKILLSLNTLLYADSMANITITIIINIIITKLILCQVTHCHNPHTPIIFSIRFDSYRNKKEFPNMARPQFQLDTFDDVTDLRTNGRPVTEDDVISAINDLSPEERNQLSQMLELPNSQNLR